MHALVIILGSLVMRYLHDWIAQKQVIINKRLKCHYLSILNLQYTCYKNLGITTTSSSTGIFFALYPFISISNS